MNRQMRRALEKKSGETQVRQKVVKVTGSELSKMRTEAMRSMYPTCMSIFLLTTYDEFEWKHFKNRQGKLDRLEKNMRKTVLGMDDIANYNAAVKNFNDVHAIVGITIQPDTVSKANMNPDRRPGARETIFTYTPTKLHEMEVESQVAAITVYLGIFLLEVYKMTGYESLETGDGAMDKLVTRIMNNVDSINDKYAQLEIHDFENQLKEELNFVVKGLD